MNAMMSPERVKLERKTEIDDELTFGVSVDGAYVGDADFLKYYPPKTYVSDNYAAVWSGPTLCVIDLDRRTIQCIERDDETHRVYQCGAIWCVQGELSVELFNPVTAASSATYSHHEVIVDSWLQDGMIFIRDFENRTSILDPSKALRRV